MRKISIISPVYNGAQYLNDFMDSILAQDYDNFELLLIDDGSTDNSASIIQEYMKKDNRIKYFYQENKGAPTARNLGIKNSTGDILYIPDCDDIVCSNTLSLFEKEMKDDVDIVVGNYCEIDEHNNVIKGLVKSLYGKHPYTNLYDYMFVEPFPGNKCFSKELIKNNELLFDDVKIGQDLNFYLKTLLKVRNIKCVDTIVYKYRIRSNSISRNYSFKIFDIVNSIQYVEDYYKKENANEYYLKNLDYLRLYHFYGQLVKVNHFESKEDKKKIIDFFKTKFKELNYLKKDKDFVYHKEVYDLYNKRLKLDFILSSNLYRNKIKKLMKR